MRTGLSEYDFAGIWMPTLFAGLYHSMDWFRFVSHRGRKTGFFCGGDILNLQKYPLWQRIIAKTSARFICENEVEQNALLKMGISAEIHPMIFDTPVEVSFQYKQRSSVYLCAHEGRKEEYGISEIERIAKYVDVDFHVYGVAGTSHDNVFYHGAVLNEQFNAEIKNYQAAIRLNHFDGFAETLGKSILMGQYPISRISYPFIDSFQTEQELRKLLSRLNYKRKPNTAREWWNERLKISLTEILK